MRFEPRQNKGLTNEELGGDNSKEALVCRTGGKLATTKLQKHRRMGNLSIRSKRVWCPDCAVAKGGKESADAARAAQYHPAGPLSQLNADFYGPLEESVRGHRVLLVVVCDAIAHVWVVPMRHRSECVAAVDKLIREVRAVDAVTLEEKVVCSVRTDNDAVFRPKAWKDMLQALRVAPVHAVP